MNLAVRLARVPDAVTGVRARHEWLDHLARAGVRYHEQHGNHLAAAITFFSVLNAVPLLMIAFAAAGYALSFSPPLLASVEAAVAAAVPPELSDAVHPVIEAAVEQRNTVAWVGLVAALGAGIWWMFNLREAVSAQWAIPPRSPVSPRRLLSDLAALLWLWIALVGTLAITAVGTGVGEDVLRLAGWPGSGWTELTRFGIGLLLGLAADWLIFFWIIRWLPRTRRRIRGAARAALLGAVGLEVLRQSLTLYLGRIGSYAGGAVFGSLLGLLVFAYLVSRFVLLVSAWAATLPGNRPPERTPAPAPPPVRTTAGAQDSGPAARLVGALVVAVLVAARLIHGRRPT